MPRRAPFAARAFPALALAACILAGCGDEGVQIVGAAPNSSAASLTEIVGCTGRGDRAPARLALRCTPQRLTLSRLRWQGWGGPSATAAGLLVRGDCDTAAPACATAATVEASDLVLGSRTAQYRSLKVTTNGDGGQTTERFAVDDRGPTRR